VSAIGKRYARALLALAQEQNQLDAVGRGLADFSATWETSAELRELFDNPAYSQDERRKVVEGVAKRMGMAPMLKNALFLLSDRRRMRYVPDVAADFLALAEERAGRVRAEVVTAGPMPESYYAELQKALEGVTGKNVVLVKRQDDSLIGGVVARVGDKVFDGSLKARLAELKDELLNR